MVKVPPSNAHSKLTSSSSALNENVAWRDAVKRCGPEATTTVGGFVSTVQSCTAHVGSTVPLVLVARTSKRCAPSLKSASSAGLVQLYMEPLSNRQWKVAFVWFALNVIDTAFELLGFVGASVIFV